MNTSVVERIAEPEDDSRARFAEAEAHVAGGRFDEAEACYAALVESGESARGLVGLGVTALVSGRPGEALSRFKLAVSVAPEEGRAHLGLGLARMELGYPRGARVSFADCLGFEPDNVTALSQLVRAAFATRDYAFAEGHLAAYLARHPESGDFRFTLAGVQLLAGRARAAERTLDELLAHHPDYPDTAAVRARIRDARREAEGESSRSDGRFVVAVIPARGGSKGIPRKNLRPLAGRPLIVHTIEAARSARFVDVVVVSTEDAEIARVARDAGAEVVERPAELATDEAPTEPALLHAVEGIEARHESTADAVLLLQATSPLRGAASIDASVRTLFDGRCDSVVAVREDKGAHFTGVVREGRFVPPYDPTARKRRQELEPLYRETGALYVATRAQLFGARCRMGGDMRPLVLPEEDAIDIDTPADFALVERILERRAKS